MGMVRVSGSIGIHLQRIPHARGDGPWLVRLAVGMGWYSPRAWGWSDEPSTGCCRCSVFPTRVGMVRIKRVVSWLSAGIPHARGDGPCRIGAEGREVLYSPRAWGWSAVGRGPSSRRTVFPTRVGMVHLAGRPRRPNHRIPHARGDGPFGAALTYAKRQYSPRAWGWSEIATNNGPGPVVFPTRVGMVRTQGQRR